MFGFIASFFSTSTEDSFSKIDGANAHHIAQNLMQNAVARAGTDPFQAQELRSAAQAYLSVVR